MTDIKKSVSRSPFYFGGDVRVLTPEGELILERALIMPYIVSTFKKVIGEIVAIAHNGSLYVQSPFEIKFDNVPNGYIVNSAVIEKPRMYIYTISRSVEADKVGYTIDFESRKDGIHLTVIRD